MLSQVYLKKKRSEWWKWFIYSWQVLSNFLVIFCPPFLFLYCDIAMLFVSMFEPPIFSILPRIPLYHFLHFHRARLFVCLLPIFFSVSSWTVSTRPKPLPWWSGALPWPPLSPVWSSPWPKSELPYKSAEDVPGRVFPPFGYFEKSYTKYPTLG